MKFHVSQLGLFDPPKKQGPLVTGTLTPKDARYTMTNLERRFFTEAKHRWPKTTWRRYHPVSIVVYRELGPSVWYAPFYCHAAKLIVVISPRDAFPYTISGRNAPLYAEHGYTVLDFSDDLMLPCDNAVWQDMLRLVEHAIRRGE